MITKVKKLKCEHCGFSDCPALIAAFNAGVEASARQVRRRMPIDGGNMKTPEEIRQLKIVKGGK